MVWLRYPLQNSVSTEGLEKPALFFDDHSLRRGSEEMENNPDGILS